MGSPRVRVRTLLIAVAVAAVMLWTGIMIQRSVAFSRLARHHAAIASQALAVSTALEDPAAMCLSYADMWRARAEEANGKDAPEMHARRVHLIEQAENWKRQAEEARTKNAPIVAYHHRLAQKYSRAASRPWLSVTPDPPGAKLVSIHSPYTGGPEILLSGW
jgi:hypothetical protein